VNTVPMFGGKRLVWLKDVNFLADTVTGRAESTLRLVEDLQAILEAVNPEETAVLVTAAPVDRRRSFPKWCEKHADFELVGGDGDGGGEALAGVALTEARSLGVSFGPGALELLLARVGANSRLIVEETRKLATYLQGDGTDGVAAVIGEAQVEELTPNVAEGDFFESAEAFFSGDLRWTLAALNRHFFAGGDARPVIAALQNRNRILLQVRALLDAGEVRAGPRGLDGLPRAAGVHGAHFAGASEKSSFNLFTQNPWYVGKLAGGAKLPTLRRLIDNQREFIAAFEDIGGFDCAPRKDPVAPHELHAVVAPHHEHLEALVPIAHDEGGCGRSGARRGHGLIVGTCPISRVPHVPRSTPRYPAYTLSATANAAMPVRSSVRGTTRRGSTQWTSASNNPDR